MDKLVSIKGLVTRASHIIPDIKEGFFRCSLCDFSVVVGIERGKITEPERCQKCRTLHSLNLVHNRCKFADKQIVRLQETPGTLAPHLAQNIVMFSFSSLSRPLIAISSRLRLCPRWPDPAHRYPDRLRQFG